MIYAKEISRLRTTVYVKHNFYVVMQRESLGCEHWHKWIFKLKSIKLIVMLMTWGPRYKEPSWQLFSLRHATVQIRLHLQGTRRRCYSLKGTVSRDWDWLFVVLMESALFRDEPLIIFIPIYCFLVFNFEFYFLQSYCTKVASLSAIGATLLQCAKGC